MVPHICNGILYFQITWTRQLDPGGAQVSPTAAREAGAVGEPGHDTAAAAAIGSPALAIASAAGKYEILTIAEMTHISDDRFIITSAAVNNVSKRKAHWCVRECAVKEVGLSSWRGWLTISLCRLICGRDKRNLTQLI